MDSVRLTSAIAGQTKGSGQNCEDILACNRRWAIQMCQERPDYFTRLQAQQAPKYMWIGCSDSRVPANQLMGLEQGEVFVNRNVANLMVPSHMNSISTLYELAVAQAFERRVGFCKGTTTPPLLVTV